MRSSHLNTSCRATKRHPPHSIWVATNRGSKAGPQRARGRLMSNRARGEKPWWAPAALPDPAQKWTGTSRPFSFDSNIEPNPQNLHRGEANGPPEPIERLGHLPGGRLRSSGMPHEGSAVTTRVFGEAKNTNFLKFFLQRVNHVDARSNLSQLRTIYK